MCISTVNNCNGYIVYVEVQKLSKLSMSWKKNSIFAAWLLLTCRGKGICYRMYCTRGQPSYLLFACHCYCALKFIILPVICSYFLHKWIQKRKIIFFILANCSSTILKHNFSCEKALNNWEKCIEKKCMWWSVMSHWSFFMNSFDVVDFDGIHQTCIVLDHWK